MCSTVREQGAVPVLSEQLKHWRRQELPCSSSAVRRERGEDLVNNFAKGFICFLFFCFFKKKTNQQTNNP